MAMRTAVTTPTPAGPSLRNATTASATMKALSPVLRRHVTYGPARITDVLHEPSHRVTWRSAGEARGISALSADGVGNSPADHGEGRTDAPRPRGIRTNGRRRIQVADVHVM